MHPEFRQQQFPLAELIATWLAERAATGADLESIRARKKAFEALGFDGEAALNTLQDILKRDQHLFECCGAAVYLAQYLDLAFLTAASDVRMRGASDDNIEVLFHELTSTTYHQGRFRRIALSHLFNFDMDVNSAAIADVRV